MVLRILPFAIAILLALRILPSVIVTMYLGLRLLVSYLNPLVCTDLQPLGSPLLVR